MPRKSRTKITWADVQSTLLSIISAILYPVIAASVFIYFTRYIIAFVNREPVTSPIQLAAVTATMGSLILVGAFYKERDTAKASQAHELKLIAKLLLAASVSLIIAFLLLETLSTIKSSTLGFGEWLIVYVGAFAMVSAAITLGFALAFLVRVIPKL